MLEGETIYLGKGWGEAHACIYWPDALAVAEYYRTEQQMDDRIALLERLAGSRPSIGEGLSGGGVSLLASDCSGYLRLYDGTGHSGEVLYLRTRSEWLDLADFGFNNRTSSYKIGPCSAYFADLAGGSGDWYPTDLTEAYDQASSMISGWNNDVSSVYIT